jgi:hypothetical protein
MPTAQRLAGGDSLVQFEIQWPASAEEAVKVLVGTGAYSAGSFFKHSLTPKSVSVSLAGASR